MGAWCLREPLAGAPVPAHRARYEKKSWSKLGGEVLSQVPASVPTCLGGPQVLVQEEGQGLAACIASAMFQLEPDLVVVGSQGLCEWG